MATESDLRKTFEPRLAHCKPGGIALFAPDYVRENFEPGADHGGHDDGTRGMRWVEWRCDPDPGDTSYLVEYGYLLREADGSVHAAEYDRHLEGLFPRVESLLWLSDAGASTRSYRGD